MTTPSFVPAPMKPRDPEHRIDTPCHVCGVFDKAPRHRVMQADGTVSIKHMDCCAADGCVDGSCNSILAACGNLQNDELVTYVRSLQPGEHTTPNE